MQDPAHLFAHPLCRAKDYRREQTRAFPLRGPASANHEVQRVGSLEGATAHERFRAVQPAQPESLESCLHFFLTYFPFYFYLNNLWNFLAIHKPNASAWVNTVPKKIVFFQINYLNSKLLPTRWSNSAHGYGGPNLPDRAIWDKIH